jgi:hypothetical protein
MSEVFTKEKKNKNKYPYAVKLSYVDQTEMLVKQEFLFLPSFANQFKTINEWEQACLLLEQKIDFTIKSLSELCENIIDDATRAMVVQKVLQYRDMKNQISKVKQSHYTE